LKSFRFFSYDVQVRSRPAGFFMDFKSVSARLSFHAAEEKKATRQRKWHTAAG